MAKFKSPVMAGIILIALWALEIGGTYAIVGYPFTTTSIIILLIMMIVTLVFFVGWNNNKI